VNPGTKKDTGMLVHFLRGTRVIAKWEFIQNIKSVRMLILVLIFALVMIGGAWGFSALFGGSTSISLPEDVLKEAMGDVFISVHVLDLDGGNISDDVLIYTFRGNGDPAAQQTFKFLDIEENRIISDGFNFTDNMGSSVYYGLAPGEYMVQLHPGMGYSVFTVKDGAAETSEISIQLVPVYELDLSELSMEDGMDVEKLFESYRKVGVIANVVDGEGRLLEGASIFVDGVSVGVTDINGTQPIDLEPGEHFIHAVYGNAESEERDVEIDEPIPKKTYFAGVPAYLGPDFVIVLVASIASLIASLAAVVLSFDAITKERAERSLDVLLTKPFPRESIVIGKYLGITGAMMAPFLAVLFVSVWIISLVSGRWPTGSVIAAYIGFMVLLIAIYVAIEILISVLAKTTGTAILSGIGLWFLLNMLWNVLTIGISELFGLEVASVSDYMTLLNPSTLFQRCVQIVSIDALIATFGLEEVKGLAESSAFSDWIFYLALALWAVISLGLAVLVFRKKEDL